MLVKAIRVESAPSHSPSVIHDVRPGPLPMKLLLLSTYFLLSVCGISADELPMAAVRTGLASCEATRSPNPQVESPAIDKPVLRPAFSDDFSNDTRAAYEIEGDVSWQPGLMTLAEGSSIRRAMNGGAWAKVQLHFRDFRVERGRGAPEFCVTLQFDGGRSIVVRFRHDASVSDTEEMTISVIDRDTSNGSIQDSETTSGTVKSSSAKHIEIECRYGLVTIRNEASILLMRHSPIALKESQQCRFECPAGSCSFSTIVVTVSGAPESLTNIEQTKLEELRTRRVKLQELQQSGNLSGALEIAEQNVDAIASVLGKRHPDYVSSANDLAVLCAQLGEYPRAGSLFDEVGRTTEEMMGEYHPNYAVNLENRANLLDITGEPENAVPLYEKSLRIRRLVLGEFHPDLSRGLSNLASCYLKTAMSDHAEKLLLQAIEIQEKSGAPNRLALAYINGNLANFYQQIGDYVRAESSIHKTIELLKAEGMPEGHPDFATALSVRGTLLLEMGEAEQAEVFFQDVLRIRTSTLTEEHPAFADSLEALAEVKKRRGDLQSAEELFNKSAGIRRKVLGERHPAYAYSLNNLGTVFAQRKEYVRADEVFTNALKIRQGALGKDHPDVAEVLNNLALNCFYLKDYVRADAFAASASQILRTRLNQGSIVQSERQQLANQIRHRRFIDTRLVNACLLPAPVDSVLDEFWQWKGSVSLRQRAYRQISGNPELGVAFARLRSLSRQLSAVQDAALPLPPVDAPQAELDTYVNAMRQWQESLESLVMQRELAEKSIAAHCQQFRNICKPLSLAVMQSYLHGGSACIDFVQVSRTRPDDASASGFVDDRPLLAFVVRPDRSPVLVDLGSVESLSDIISAFRSGFRSERGTAAEFAAVEAAAMQLRQKLWIPIEAHLDGIDTVIISPDTVLGTLPFAALPGKRNGTYLLEDYRISILPMASLLPELFERASTEIAGGGLLVLGDIDYDTKARSQEFASPSRPLLAESRMQREAGQLRSGHVQDWAALPGFREELDSIRGLFLQQHPQQSIAVLSGNQATEAAFLDQAHRYRTLHLITHGYFEDPDVKSIHQTDARPDALSSQVKSPATYIATYLPGLLSGLAMAGANKPSEDPEDPHDGILRASEIEASSLQGVDLVVLSACETGLGAVAGGEGLTGLQRAFQVAGARTVVASLWKVDDRATQELMTQFYTNLWLKRQSKVDALRNAQLYLLRNPVLPDGTQLTRGDINKTKPVFPDPAENRDATDPFFWAAWTLSGDWR